MSGIAAIIRFDGGTVEPGAIEKITTAMSYRGPDGIRHWIDGPVALGHCMLHTTEESLEEVQPLLNEDGSLALVMDGWLSNWEELRSELLTRGARLRTRSDAELVLRAYEVWGEDCPMHIDGEFAFLIWDSRRREAYCTCDHAGLRSLYYHWDEEMLVVATDINGVLAEPRVPRRLNRGVMAEYMAARWFREDETIWEEVSRLSSAHWMWFGPRGTRNARYWSPPLQVTLTYAREQDYIAHYLDMLTDCVRRASRSHLPVACEVSGGLDSSAVFALAHRIRKEGNLSAPGLKGYTMLFEQRGSEVDEIEFVHAVRDHLDEPIEEIPAVFPDLDWFKTRGRMDMDVPPAPNAAIQIGLFEAAVHDGSRAILSGQGGDEWLDGSHWYYAEQLMERQWAALGLALREDFRDAGLIKTAGWLFRFGFGQLIPERARALRRGLMSGVRQLWHDDAPYLTKEMQQLLARRREKFDDTPYLAVLNKARQMMARTLWDAYNNRTRGRTSLLAARSGYDLRTPMHSRPYIEFAFATPERIRHHGNITKHIHRRALANYLPDKVLDRMTKAEFALTFDSPIQAMQKELLDPKAKLDDYVTRQGMEKLCERYRTSPGWPIWQLWGIFGCYNLMDMVDSVG